MHAILEHMAIYESIELFDPNTFAQHSNTREDRMIRYWSIRQRVTLD